MLANINMNWLVGGETPPRLGNAHPNIVPYQVFATSDGHFILACGNDSQFARIAELCGHAEWAADPRFARNADRVAHRAELVPLLAEVFVTRTRDEWLAALDAAGVPNGPINTVDQAFADPQIVARGMRLDLPDAQGAPVPQVACPIQLSARQ
ncbi:MAG: CoA transferase [Rivihabitans pingtungensis]